MKQLLLPIFFLLTVVSIAQTIDAPIGYTTFLNLKQYAYEANPGADSLNHNNTLIDNFAKAIKDSTDDLKADVRNIIGYDGGIIDGAVAWADLATATKAQIVQVTGTQSIAGVKTLTDNLNTENVIPTAGATYNLGSLANEWYRIYTRSLRTHQLVIVNPVDTSETAEVSYNGAEIDFGANKIVADTISGLTAVSSYQEGTTISDVTDSSITVPYCNIFQFLLPGANMTNLEEISMSDMPSGSIGHELTLWINPAQDFNITFQDVDGAFSSDGNLQLAGDFDMDAGDILKLVWVSDYDGGYWLEVSRSSNR